ncbi:uncharacterized protein LOC111617118, partial [Centruroides sculpturatus]|uniref:uncharacterized protein LOC111617118 n=1 Tax=Centruroides sculpturatus TaxID=218467 RepID=UPI000C6E029B
MPEITSILKKKTSTDGERQQLLSTVGQGDADSDAETTHSPGTSDEMTPILGRRGKTESSSHTSASSDADSRTSSEGAIYRVYFSKLMLFIKNQCNGIIFKLFLYSFQFKRNREDLALLLQHLGYWFM